MLKDKVFSQLPKAARSPRCEQQDDQSQSDVPEPQFPGQKVLVICGENLLKLTRGFMSSLSFPQRAFQRLVFARFFIFKPPPCVAPSARDNCSSVKGEQRMILQRSNG